MPVKGADGCAQSGPNAVVIDPRRHDQDQHFMRVNFGRVDDFDQHRFIRIPVAFAPYRPSIHLRGHMAQGRHLAHGVQVFHWRVIGQFGGIERHLGLLKLLRRRIAGGLRLGYKQSRKIATKNDIVL